MLSIFSSQPFYTEWIRLPGAHKPVDPHIKNSGKLKFLEGALGAINGSHIHVSIPAVDRGPFRNRKGSVTQNCLFMCSFSLQFLYTLTGWEGSATNARMWEEACRTGGLHIPPGRYYLADTGFPSCPELLIPYRSVQYHLAEWGRAGARYVYHILLTTYLIHSCRPKTREELFNLRHTSARNVTERIFGVLKRRYRILSVSPEFNLEIQSRIPCALAAVHNFIRQHDEKLEEFDGDDINDNQRGGWDDPDEETSFRESAIDEEPSALRDSIAQAMWEEYVTICAERGIPVDGYDTDII